MTWEMVPLKDIGTWYGGGTPSKSKAEFWDGGTVPWLSPKDMGGDVLSGTKDHITESAIRESSVKRVPAKSVAMVVRSGVLEHTFPSAIIPFQTTLNQDMKAILARPDVEPQWLAWGIKAYERTILRTCRKSGTTVASIDTKRLQEFCLPVPSIEKQRNVMSLIEAHLSRLEAANNSLKLSKKKVFNAQSESLRQYFSNIDGEWTTLGRVASWGSGGTPKSKTPAFYENGEIPWVNSGDLNDGPVYDAPKKITEAGLNSSSAKWVPQDSVLVAMYGATIGKTGITRKAVTTNQAVAFAKPDTSIITPKYLFWYMRSQARLLAAAGQGGAQPNISQAVLKAWPILVPHVQRQHEIVARAEDLFASFNALNEQLITAQRQAEYLRRSILFAAYEGRLTATRPSVLDLPLTSTPHDLTATFEASLI